MKPALRFVLAICGGAVACAPPALTPTGSRVEAMKADPPSQCAEVGSVEGFWNGDGYEDSANGAKTKLRNAAGERGANYVRLETTNGAGTRFTGTAFKCPDGVKVPEGASSKP